MHLCLIIVRQTFVQRLTERGQLGDTRIGPGLVGRSGPGDDDGDLLVVEDPALRELCHGERFGHKVFQIFCQLDTLLKWQAGKSFPHIELLPVAVIGAMIGRGEFRVLVNLSGK